MLKRKIEIIAFERERVITQSVNFTCTVCCERSEILTTRQACALLQVSASSIRRWIFKDKIHGFRTPGGRLRICRNSLLLPVEQQHKKEKQTANNIKFELPKNQPEKLFRVEQEFLRNKDLKSFENKF